MKLQVPSYTFTQKKICESEILTLTKKIKENEHELARTKNRLQQIMALLDNNRAKIIQVENENVSLPSQTATGYYTQRGHSDNFGYQSGITLRPNYPHESAELKKLKRQQQTISRSIDSINENISIFTQQINSDRNRINYLKNEHIPRLEKFMDEFHYHPELLFNTFLEKARQVFNDFDQSHFHQDREIRFCLYKFNEKLNYITKYSNPNLQQQNEEYWQYKYVQLCGFLHQMYSLFESKCDFSNLLANLLIKCGISKEDGFPDKNNDINCIQYFKSLELTKPKLFFHIESLMQHERLDYNKAYKKLYDLSNVDNSVETAMMKGLLEEIENVVMHPEMNTDEGILKLYTRVLNQTFLYFNLNYKNDNFQQAGKDLIKLADHVSGKPSTPKRLATLLLTFAGLVLLGVGIAMLLPAFNLTAHGIDIGQSYFAKLASLFTCLGSAGLIATGLSLFAYQSRTGVSKQLKTIVKTVDEFSKRDDAASLEPITRYV